MKKIKIDFKSLAKSNRNSSWEKALLTAVLLSLVISAIAYGYIVIRPLPQEAKSAIEEEISSSDINFDQKLFDELKARQNPSDNTPPSTGKNPFASF